MKRLIFLFVLSIGLCSNAMEVQHRAGGGGGQKACKKLSEEKRSAIEDAIIDFKLGMADLRANVKKARLQFRKTIRDPQATLAQGQSAADNLLAARKAAITSRINFRTQTIFTLGEGVEKKWVARCLRAKMKRMRRGPGNGRRGNGPR